MSEDFDRNFSERLGQRVSEALAHGPNRNRMLAQRARLIEWEQRRGTHGAALPGWLVPGWLLGYRWGGPEHGRPRWLPLGVGMASVCAAALGLWLLWGPVGERSALEVTLAGNVLEADAWVTSAGTASLLEFSDGSEIALDSGGRARVTQLDQAGARLTLESGTVEASIVPKTGYRWVVQAGPYQVSVLGTVFSVQWAPETERIEVSVTRGKVQVSGGPEVNAERVLVAGDRLVATGTTLATNDATPPAGAEQATGATEVTELPAAQDAQPSEAVAQRVSKSNAARVGSGLRVNLDGEAPSDEAAEQPNTLAPEPAQPPSSDSEPAEPSQWKVLAKNARYAEAVSAARVVGTDSLLATSSATDLLLLADAARLSGAVALARSSLLTLRKRFAGHPNATVAAFTLGRLAFEVQHDYGEAVRWFRTYLQAAPSGSLAEGARGRLLMAQLRLGNQDAARKAAKDYIAHHPKGRHATVAKSLLDD